MQIKITHEPGSLSGHENIDCCGASNGIIPAMINIKISMVPHCNSILAAAFNPGIYACLFFDIKKCDKGEYTSYYCRGRHSVGPPIFIHTVRLTVTVPGASLSGRINIKYVIPSYFGSVILSIVWRSWIKIETADY